MLILMDPNYRPPTGGLGPQDLNIPTVTPNNNPYGFIMDAPHKPKKSLLPSGNSAKSRLLVVLGGLFVLFVVFSILMPLIFGSKDNSTTQLKSLAAEQQEIVRVATLGVQGAFDPALTSYAQTTKLTVQSQQNEVLGYLASHKIKIAPKLLTAVLNSKTDTALIEAKASNRYDEIFSTTIKSELATYAGNLQTAYKNAGNPKSKAMLARDYNNVQLLLK